MAAPDNPIEKAADDRLERRAHAWDFADQLLSMDASKGLVAAVYGPWGSGKTSYINFMRHRLEKQTHHVVIDYNPWMFSGADQLVESFFHELGVQLKLKGGKFAAIGEQVASYGELLSGLGWLPFVGVWLERARLISKLGKAASKNKDVSAAMRRKTLEAALSELDKPIFVVVDDVDRLATSEIQDMFKLVRVTAHFPNVIYVLAFDRLYAEVALADREISGRLYLEKIVQVGANLPEVSQPRLTDLTFEGLNEVTSGVPFYSKDDRARFSNAYHRVIKPLIRNVRDIRRYCIAVEGAVRRLGGQMSLTDLLVMEAVRTFLPETYASIRTNNSAVTTIVSGLGHGTHRQETFAQALEKVRDEAENPTVAAAILEELFPPTQSYLANYVFGKDSLNEWLLERRVAHSAILALYYEGSAGDDLTKHLAATELWLTLENPEEFESALAALAGEELRDRVLALETFQRSFEAKHAVPAISAIANNIDRMPTELEAFFALRPAVVLRQLTRLFLAAAPSEARPAVVQEAISRTTSLGAQLLILDAASGIASSDEPLVSDATFLSQASTDWLERVKASPAPVLARESALLTVLGRAKELDPSLPVPEDPEVVLALLRSAYDVTTALTFGGGSSSETHSDRLHWDNLLEVLGPASHIAQLAAAAKPYAADEHDRLVIALAERYASGWSPSS